MATDQKSIASAIVWLEGLADLCVHGSEGRPTKGRLKQIAEQLCELLPSAAFTSASARLCAKGDFFPGFDTMQTRLAEYWAAAISVFARYNGPYTDEMRPAVEMMMNKRVIVRVDPVRVRSWDHRKLGMAAMEVAGSTAEFIGNEG